MCCIHISVRGTALCDLKLYTITWRLMQWVWNILKKLWSKLQLVIFYIPLWSHTYFRNPVATINKLFVFFYLIACRLGLINYDYKKSNIKSNKATSKCVLECPFGEFHYFCLACLYDVLCLCMYLFKYSFFFLLLSLVCSSRHLWSFSPLAERNWLAPPSLSGRDNSGKNCHEWITESSLGLQMSHFLIFLRYFFVLVQHHNKQFSHEVFKGIFL